jgi:hypothetical protein
VSSGKIRERVGNTDSPPTSMNTWSNTTRAYRMHPVHICTYEILTLQRLIDGRNNFYTFTIEEGR